MRRLFEHSSAEDKYGYEVNCAQLLWYFVLRRIIPDSGLIHAFRVRIEKESRRKVRKDIASRARKKYVRVQVQCTSMYERAWKDNVGGVLEFSDLLSETAGLALFIFTR